MDEFTKSLILAAIGGGLAGAIITKLLDFWFAVLQDKREFRRSQRQKAREEIEELKNQIGTIYELSSNWNDYNAKLPDYAPFFARDHEVTGRYNKYPGIAAAARDTVHFCKIVAHGEQEADRRGDLIANKKELTAKYLAFIEACDKYIEGLP